MPIHRKFARSSKGRDVKPARPKSSIAVQYAAAADDLPARRLLREWARAALGGAASTMTIVLRFVDEAESRALNRHYRGRNRPTNVLSFVYDDEHGAPGGDIVLCAPVLRREAAEQGKPLPAHCAHLVVHGVLHLLGYDHQETPEAEKMEARERVLLAGLGFGDPYATPQHTAEPSSSARR
jgi:probable rRNA maturation factor